MVQLEDPYGGGRVVLVVERGRRSEDPRGVDAGEVAAEVVGEPPVGLFERVDADRVLKAPVGVQVPGRPGRDEQRGGVAEAGELLGGLGVVGLDEDELRVADGVAPSASAIAEQDAGVDVGARRPGRRSGARPWRGRGRA